MSGVLDIIREEVRSALALEGVGDITKGADFIRGIQRFYAHVGVSAGEKTVLTDWICKFVDDLRRQQRETLVARQQLAAAAADAAAKAAATKKSATKKTKSKSRARTQSPPGPASTGLGPEEE